MPISIISNIKITLFFTISFLLIQINSQLSHDITGTCYLDDKADQYKSQTDIDEAITQLISNASNTYFNNISTGSGINQFNALYYCRYDFSLKTCKSCVESAFDRASSCLPNKEGSRFFEECVVYYSNHSRSSESSQASVHSGRNLTMKEQSNFSQILGNTLSNLINNVSSIRFNTSSRYFATTSEKYSPTETLYAIAKCNPYIAPSNCSTCLRDMFDLFKTANSNNGVNAQMCSPDCQLSYVLSDEELSRPWNFQSYIETHPNPSSSPTRTQGSSIVGAMMASISSVALCLFLL